MSFIVLETHGGPEYAYVTCKEDGEAYVFETYEEAEEHANYFQSVKIVEL